MKRIITSIVLLALLMSIAIPTYSLCEGLSPQASEEISEASISLTSGKKIVYDVVLTSQVYTVSVNYCKLYKENSSGSWEFVTSMPEGIPGSKKGDLTVSCDISDYINSSGKYQVRVSITAGNSTVYRSTSRTY